VSPIPVPNYRHIQKSLTGLADARLLKVVPEMRLFDRNVAEGLFFFEDPIIEAPPNREIHFQTSFRKFHQRLPNLAFLKGKKRVFMACQARQGLE
jgi:hypothetical protein